LKDNAKAFLATPITTRGLSLLGSQTSNQEKGKKITRTMIAFGICALLSLTVVHAFNPLRLSSKPRMTGNGFIVTWEQDMADEIRRAAESCESLPYMVAIVGIPGSGKTTSATILGELLQERNIPTMVMPFDGYHLMMETLQSFPNAGEVIYRRGGPDNFDPQALRLG
jgi:hypothetical protein